MKIIADTPTLFTPEEANELDITVVPACAIVDGTVYRDFIDIDSADFLKMVEDGAVPTTSQPAIGDILEVYESCDDEMLVLPIGDGLSSTYSSMLAARSAAENSERIHVADTGTLAVPQRYLVKKARKLADEGLRAEEILQRLKESIGSTVSFVIPTDFKFLQRSGRLTPVAARMLSMIRIVPVMTQTDDKKRISLFTVKLSVHKALEAIAEHLKKMGVGKNWLIGICHGGVEKEAEHALAFLKEQLPGAEGEMHLLPPSLVTHGGPGCIVVQAVLM